MKYKFEKPVEGSIGLAIYQCTVEWRNGKSSERIIEQVTKCPTGALTILPARKASN